MADSGVHAARKEFDSICRRLNMDQGTLEDAWKSFVDLKEFYTLEGNQNHWLACALFVACRTAVIPTVDGGASTTGNRVTLYTIIRETKISLLEFFERMKRWVEMALKHGLAKEVPTLVDSLEHRFRVITLIYRKYDDLFQTVFATPTEETRRRPSRSRCSSSDLHKFVWTLFVHARACLNGVQDNLVNSFHLLICVVETMYISVEQADRVDLLNQAFVKAVEASIAEDPSTEKEVVDFLCQRYEADVMDVKVIREHWWERHLEEIKDKEIILDHLHEIVEGSSFLRNSKRLNREYEMYVLKVGDLDERVFLGEFAQAEVGTPIKVSAGSSVINDNKSRRNLDRFFANANSGVVPNTPLTSDRSRKETIRSPGHLSTPVSSALHNISRIKSIISNQQQQQPVGARLQKLCKEIEPNPYDAVVKRVDKIKQRFVEKYCSAGSDTTSKEEGRTISSLGSSLYFKVLEAVALDEHKKRGTARLLSLLQADDMHLAMLGCCLQIVLTTKNTSDKMFPWIMEALDIPAYSFARVIESVIHFEPNLSSSMVKSLKVAEERLLESLVWHSGSPVFDHIRDIGRVYRYKEVALPDSCADSKQQQATQSPVSLSQRRISARKLTFDDHPATSPAASTETTEGSTAAAATATTTTTSTSTTFSLHTLSEAASMVGMDGSSSSGGNSNSNSTVSNVAKDSNSTVSNAAKDSNSSVAKLTSSIQTTGTSSACSLLASTGDTSCRGDQAAAPPETQPIRNSVSLFLRKVYHLASLRLNFLCQRLQMDPEQQQTCWTCFEECMVQHIEALRDRHIDQFIMCSIYAVGKVLKKDVDFGVIVRFYRYQPHSSSVFHSGLLPSSVVKTYRQVMISRSADSDAAATVTTTATTSTSAAASLDTPPVPEREAPVPAAVAATAVATASKLVADAKIRDDDAPSTTPKGSPVTRSVRRQQQQQQQQQQQPQQQPQIKHSSALERPSSPRRSPRKRQHDNDTTTATTLPSSALARGPLFSSSPPRKRKDFGASVSTQAAAAKAVATEVPPPAAQTSASTSAPPLAKDPVTGDDDAEVAMDTSETIARPVTPRNDMQSHGAPPGLLSPPIALPDGQCIGDIIAFYNKVYLRLMKDFLLQFLPERVDGGTSPCLSPMPKSKSKPSYSPRKQVSAHHNIFVSPRKKDYSSGGDRTRLQEGWLYCHQKSSLSDLHVINNHIRRGIASPVKSPRPHQSPLASTGNTASSAIAKHFIPSGIMVESVSLDARSQARPITSPAAVDRHKSVTNMLHKKAEDRWLNSKGLAPDMSP